MYMCIYMHTHVCVSVRIRCVQKAEGNIGYSYLPSPLLDVSLVHCCSCKAIWPGKFWGFSCLSPILLQTHRDHRCAPPLLGILLSVPHCIVDTQRLQMCTITSGFVHVLGVRTLILKLVQQVSHSLSISPAPWAYFLAYSFVRYHLPHSLTTPCHGWCSHRHALHFLLSLGANGCLCSSFLSPAGPEVTQVWVFQ